MRSVSLPKHLSGKEIEIMKQEERLVTSSLVESETDSEKVAQGEKLKETEGIISIPFNQLHEFKGHPFKVENDMELFELMRSIEKEGVIVPALVRPNPYGSGYEVIAGHSMLPFGWTLETLLGSHVSKPYNPDIARVFYRAGYIESWGRGIQKIRDACKNLGSEEPEYIVHGEDIMVKFSALQSAKVADSKVPNRHGDGLGVGLDGGLEKEIIKMIYGNPKITMGEIAEELNVTKRTIERTVKSLREKSIMERKGGKRYGYWEVHR